MTEIVVVISILFVLFLMLLPVLGPGSGDVVSALTLGWLAFLRRTLPQITWNWDLMAMAALCITVILLLGHRLAFRLTTSIARATGRDWRWPRRWTLCGLIALGLGFLVGMCTGGIAHQVGWLSSQTESWYERKGELFLDMRQLATALDQAVLDAGHDVKKIRQILNDPELSYLRIRSGESPLPERFHVLLIVDSTDTVIGSIMLPRNFASRPHARLIYSFENKNDYLPMEKLPELIQKHQRQLLTL
ncbi:MAG TPA: hypothetical protein VFZ59_12025 [Verrucomicrobiae bacterium]|nr:hypothetical protein [Verrucomicrobiae bacterium]